MGEKFVNPNIQTFPSRSSSKPDQLKTSSVWRLEFMRQAQPEEAEALRIMQTIKLNTHIGTDGILKLEVPVASLTDTDIEVILVVQAIRTGAQSQSPISNLPGSGLTGSDHKEPVPDELGVENGWPPGFFRRTYGSLSNNPLERAPQGDYEERDELEA